MNPETLTDRFKTAYMDGTLDTLVADLTAAAYQAGRDTNNPDPDAYARGYIDGHAKGYADGRDSGLRDRRTPTPHS